MKGNSMKTRIAAIALLSLLGCAHQTVHDYCVENSAHYSNYDECYAERSQDVARRKAALKNAFQSFGQGVQGNSTSTSCTSQTYGANTYTNCNNQ